MGATAEMMLRSFGRTCRATGRAIRPERERIGAVRAGAAGGFLATDLCYVPAFWRLLMLAIRLVPERVFKRLDL